MADTAPPTNFSYGQVRDVLARSFGVQPSKLKTFEARIQQLQKLGLPRGTNVGRAGRARYTYAQLAELALFFDLLDAGTSPAALKANFAQGVPFYGMVAPEAVEQGAKDGSDIHYVLSLNSLASLRSSDPSRAGSGPADHVQRTRPGSMPLSDVDQPYIAVNLTRRLRQIKVILADLAPIRRSN